MVNEMDKLKTARENTFKQVIKQQQADIDERDNLLRTIKAEIINDTLDYGMVVQAIDDLLNKGE
jgi:hypothetical protein